MNNINITLTGRGAIHSSYLLNFSIGIESWNMDKQNVNRIQIMMMGSRQIDVLSQSIHGQPCTVQLNKTEHIINSKHKCQTATKARVAEPNSTKCFLCQVQSPSQDSDIQQTILKDQVAAKIFTSSQIQISNRQY